MITPAAAKEARKSITDKVMSDLMVLVPAHAKDTEKEIDKYLISSGTAHQSQRLIKISGTASNIIEQHATFIHDLKNTFTLKVLGHLETAYRQAGWVTILKKEYDRLTWELVIKEKEVDDK